MPAYGIANKATNSKQPHAIGQQAPVVFARIAASMPGTMGPVLCKTPHCRAEYGNAVASSTDNPGRLQPGTA